MKSLPIALLSFATVAAAQPARVTPAQQEAAFQKVLTGEDQRDAALIREAMAEDSSQRRRGIRALGRLEQPDLVRYVAPAINDNVGIRAEAADALAQLARTPDTVAQVQDLLLERAGLDADAGLWEVWGELAAALGRLPYDTTEQVARTEIVLAQGLPSPDSLSDVDTAQLSGAVRGLEALARTVRAKKLPAFSTRTWDLLRWAATAQRPAADPRSALTRRRAMAALVTGNEATTSIIERALLDSDAEVRRLAAVAAGNEGDINGRDRLLAQALKDADAHVRWDALRSWGRQLQASSCAPMRDALKDADAQVRLLAIDLLGSACPASANAAALLAPLAAPPPATPRSWHASSHALVSLAKIAPGEAARLLPAHASHGTWQVRMYAARAAAALKDTATLARLAQGDATDNVREAALSGLIDLDPAAAARLALDALGRPDYQLVITATKALADPARPAGAAQALVTALGRITAERKDTSRDPRMAILDRLDALNAKDQAPNLEGYLKDFDPLVAARAAGLLQKWTGTPRTATPQPIPAPAVTPAMVVALRGKSLRFHMAAGGSFDVSLDVESAPLSAARVARRAGEGYYNGLTFHRVVPNFVIQGGSPGANEYAGDARYMRDEPGLHLRGTVGISTRGHDTGDAQVFVNLVDSPRLDHLYTVVGSVTSGMEVVDGVIEGDVIERVELVGR